LLSERFQWFAFNEHKGWSILIAIGVVGVAVVVMLVWLAVTLLLRRRFQFSFRSLLVFVVTVSMLLGWFAMEMQKAGKQREAVEAIVGMGRHVYYDFQIDEAGFEITGAQSTAPVWLRKSLGDDFFSDVVAADLYGTTDAGLEHVKALTGLEVLYLGDTQVTDVGLEHLRELTGLRYLRLRGTKVTDAGLEDLKGLTSLQRLSLSNTRVTDAGLQHLKGLTSLQRLGLNDTLMTDAGLEHLTGLTQLEWLDISGIQLTDAGLEHLKKLTSLKTLYLGGTRVTPKVSRNSKWRCRTVRFAASLATPTNRIRSRLVDWWSGGGLSSNEKNTRRGAIA